MPPLLSPRFAPVYRALLATRERSPASFDRWFSAVQFDDFTDGVLSLRAKDSFVRDWVSEHYLPSVVQSLRGATELSIQLAWTLGEIEHAIVNDLDGAEPESGAPASVEIRPTAARPNFRPEPMPHAPASQRAALRGPTSSSQPANPLADIRRAGHPQLRPVESEFGQIQLLASLNPKCTFVNFVVGPSNQLAHAASVAAAGDGASRRYSPLFICGGTGLGKTHLMQAIAHQVLGDDPTKRVLYVSAERFTNEFIRAIQNKQMDEFRHAYRVNCDLLLVDDIQFLAGREQTQEEFFHTFNALYALDRPIVMTSDKYPQQLERMEERLVSRFNWGLVADIQVPELETRVAIVRKKAEVEGIVLPDEVAIYLAQTVRSNVRELEGTLIRLAAKSSLTGQTVDLAFAQKELSVVHSSRPQVTNIEDIQRAVCHHFNLRSADMVSKARHKSIALARHVAMYLCKQRLNVSFPELGRAFRKDHTTVMSAVRKVKRLREDDAQVRAHLEAIERKLGDG